MLVLPVNYDQSQGSGGEPGTYYVHVQNEQATEWTIIHNLGRRPSITLYAFTGEVFMAYIYHANDNVAGVRLNAPLNGVAYCT